VSAAAEHTHYLPSTPPQSLGITADVAAIRKVPEEPTWQSWPPCRNRMYLSSIRLLIIRSSNHFSEQCHGPNALGEDCNTIRWQKGSSKSLRIPSLSTTPLYLDGPKTATAFVPATQSQATMDQGKCPVNGCGQSRITPDCRRELCRKRCRGLGCTSKNHPPKTPSRTAPAAPLFFMPPLPSYPPCPLPLPHHPWV